MDGRLESFGRAPRRRHAKSSPATQQQAEVVTGGGERGAKIKPPAVVRAPTMAGP